MHAVRRVSSFDGSVRTAVQQRSTALHRSRAAPLAGGGAIGPRRDPALGPHALCADHRRGPQARGLLPRAPSHRLRVDAPALRGERADRRPHGHRAPALARQARRRGRPRPPWTPWPAPSPRRATPGATRRSSATTRSCAGCSPRRTTSRRRCSTTARCRTRSWNRRAPDVRGRPRRPHQGLPERRRRPARRDRPLAGPRGRQAVPHRHPHRLHRPRRDHRRLPAGQPDHHRGATVDGQVGPGHEHRRERRAAQDAAAAGGAVQPRDVRGRARAALHRQPGPHPRRRPAQGPAQGGAQVEARARRRRALPARTALHRRLLRHLDPRDPRQGARGCTPRRRPRAAWG